MKKPAVPIVTLWTDYQLVPLLWVRHRYNSSITIFCFNANTEKRFFALSLQKVRQKKDPPPEGDGSCANVTR